MRGKATSRDKRETSFEIRERTFQFVVQVTELVRKMPRTLDAVEIGCQLLRSGTSIGANVEEAHGAESRRAFIHKMSIARKQARESRYWLRLISAAIRNDDAVQLLVQESDELVRILSAIAATAKKKL
jgi:four helix bundle protein